MDILNKVKNDKNLKFKKGVLVLNPSSGKFYNFLYLKKIIEYFNNLGIEINLKKTLDRADIRRKTEEGLKEGADFVGALGGDGTIREAGSILVEAGIPMLIIPFGTSNVLAYSLNIPLNPLKAVKLFENGKVENIDCGIANGEYFFFIASTGIDAKVMSSQNIHFKKIFGRFSFYPSLIKNILLYNFPEINIECEGLKSNGFYAAVSNVPYFAGKFKLFEDSYPSDGFLDLIVLKEKGIKNYLKYFIELQKKKIFKSSSAEVKKIKEIEIKSKSEVPYQLDGDPKGNLPLKILVKERALSLFFP